MGILRDGENILAIQTLNSSIDDTDLLFDVNLEAKIQGRPIAINENTQITARNLDEADRGPQSTFITTDWSGVVTHRFIVESPQLAITEINYNPIDLDPSDDFGRGSYEFIEVQNLSSTATADLTGARLTNGVEFDFTTGDVATLAPGARVLIVGNTTAFEQRYGGGLPVAGEFTGNLANGGELVELTGGDGSSLFSVSYGDSDPWPAFADGSGASLELIDPASVTPSNQGKYYSWQASSDLHGSPGSASSDRIGVVVNEVLSRTDDAGGPSDAVELHNATEAAIDIGGWFLSDDADELLKFEVPTGTSIPAGGYVVFDESDFNAVGAENGFAFDGAEGDEVHLVIPNAARDGVESFIDSVSFGSANDLESFGRVPNATGRLAPLAINSLGSENGLPRVGPLVMTELNYNPGPPSAAALAVDPSIESRDLEFIEIYNPTSSAAELTNWQIRGGADYDFDTGESIAAGETLVVVPFNPENPDNAARLLAFRAHYGIDDSVRVIGGYQGNLNNSSDRIQLQRPDTPPIDQPGLIPGLYEDEVLYDDIAPWPAADGTGDSINRGGSLGFGNSADSWVAQSPTPGRVEFSTTPGDFTGDAVLDAHDIDFLCGSISGPYNASFDIDANGDLDLGDIEAYVSRFLNTVLGDVNLDGQVNATDLNVVGLHWQQMGDANWMTGDFTCDGSVDAVDLNQVGLNWQFAAAAVRTPRAPLAFMGESDFARVADRVIDELSTDVVTQQISESPRDVTHRTYQHRNFAERRSIDRQGSPNHFKVSQRLIDHLLANLD